MADVETSTVPRSLKFWFLLIGVPVLVFALLQGTVLAVKVVNHLHSLQTQVDQLKAQDVQIVNWAIQHEAKGK